MRKPEVIVVGTTNKGKFHTYQDLMGDKLCLVDPFSQSAKDEGIKTLYKEPGYTVFSKSEYGDDNLLALAIRKAVAYAQATKCWAIADATGLYIADKPRAYGMLTSDHAANYKDGVRVGTTIRSNLPRSKPSKAVCRNLLLLEMSDTTDRDAYFMTALALSSPQGEVPLLVTGTCHGSIATEVRGESEFTYDPLFIVDGYEQTYAELDEQKDEVSHRGIAARRFAKMYDALWEA